jgi:hypothetical protein
MPSKKEQATSHVKRRTRDRIAYTIKAKLGKISNGEPYDKKDDVVWKMWLKLLVADTSPHRTGEPPYEDYPCEGYVIAAKEELERVRGLMGDAADE